MHACVLYVCIVHVHVPEEVEHAQCDVMINSFFADTYSNPISIEMYGIFAKSVLAMPSMERQRYNVSAHQPYISLNL